MEWARSGVLGIGSGVFVWRLRYTSSLDVVAHSHVFTEVVLVEQFKPRVLVSFSKALNIKLTDELGCAGSMVCAVDVAYVGLTRSLHRVKVGFSFSGIVQGVPCSSSIFYNWSHYLFIGYTL